MAAPFDPSLAAHGVRLSETAQALAARGGLDDVPVLIGSNADEEALFTLGMLEPGDDELSGLFGELSDDAQALMALYPAADYDTNLARYREMRTDVRFACPTLAFAEAATGDVYVYHYTYVSPDDPFGLGAPHGAELVPLFAHPEGIVGLEPGLTGRDAAVSEDMQAAWVAFAATGDPGDQAWRPYGDGGQVTLVDAPFELTDEIRGGRCEAVDELTNLPR